MKVKIANVAVSFALCAASATQARAESFVEHSAEFRMQLDFVVADTALRKFLPSGWETNIATQGPAKDCNLRVIFIDRVDITGADGAPMGTNRLVYLAVPVKQNGSTAVGQMIIAGLTTDPKDAPGPFGNYEFATSHRMERSVAASTGKDTLMEEHWEFATASGERLEAHLKYERSPARKGSSEVKFFSPTNPSSYQIFKTEQGIDIMRNATINVRDRVKEFSYTVAGRLGSLFDGTERVVSIDSFHWYNRGIYLP